MTATAVSNTGLLGAGSFNGLTWGLGTGISVAGIVGWDDLAPMVTNNSQRPREEGLFSGQDFLSGRIITVDFDLYASTQAALWTLIGSLQAATVKQTTELPLLMFGSSRLSNVRPRKRAIAYDASTKRRTATASVEFFATDPRIYDANATTLTCDLAQTSGGFTFNFGFNLGFGQVSSGNTLTATNSGNFETRPVFTIAGPCTNPTIEAVNSDGDSLLTFAITLAVGDTLTVDTNDRSIVLNGTASRRSTLAAGSQWFRYPPGNTTLTFRANAYQAAATLTSVHRSAWI